MLKFLLQPIRAFEFTSPVFDYLKYPFTAIKPLSSIIFAHPKLRHFLTRREVNERILEIPFVFSQIGDKHLRILDVGACESPVSLSLASMGHSVTAVDTRKYPFPHPNLNIVVQDITRHQRPNFYDLIICLSTLEHIGIEVYGNRPAKDLDKQAIAQMYACLKPGGQLLLTTPVDISSGFVPGSRVYDLNTLKSLLKSFKKVQITLGIKNRNQIWTEASSFPKDFKSTGLTPCAVALIKAYK